MRGGSGDGRDGDDDLDVSPPRGTDDASAAEEGDSRESVDDSTTNGDGARSPKSDPMKSASTAPTASTTAGDSTEPSEIDPSALTVSERSLHPRIRILWIVRAVLWGLVLGAILYAGTWAWLDVAPAIPAAITAVLLILFVAHAILRYRAWSYEFREDAIYLERGVLTRVRTVVPFVRIQHIDTARGPIERAAGLSTLVVYTAGSRGADVTIPGIEADRATDHQRRLKQLAIAAEDDTAV